MEDVLIGWPGGSWQATARLVAFIVGGYLFVLWLASVLWVYRDIRSRTRDPISQFTGVAIATAFPLVGLPVYMVVRPNETLQEAYDRQLEQEAILSELHSVSACPNCRRPIQDDFMVCAHCATSLKQPCRNCGQLMQFSWRVCPFCATPREVAQPRRETQFDASEREEAELRPAQSRTGTRSRASVDGDGDETGRAASRAAERRTGASPQRGRREGEESGPRRVEPMPQPE